MIVWHEQHLPTSYILILATLTLIIGSLVFLASIIIYTKLLNIGFHPVYEFCILVVFYFALQMSGFLENRAGVVFVLIFLGAATLFRIIRTKLHYLLAMLAMILMANGLLSFVFLQKIELYTAYHLFRSAVQFTEADLSGWKWEEETRTLSNRSIPISMILPDTMFFHNPEDLGLKDKTGTGQIAGIISASDHDPNAYPFIRIFYFPAFIPVENELIRVEVEKYIQFQEKQGEIEDVNEIQPDRGTVFPNASGTNAFWTFYDIIRPRYAKTGYYFLRLEKGPSILLHLTENLEKGDFHEPSMDSLLESIRFIWKE
ncbi:hypothetical protein [Leptospira sp. GIMC2001]|uniref:hypothetical protein n=1 Tax=Leptospira sp. GIMC2001 TaxID=1513297 RepID=UPI00234BE854|nr:hypothetical protein [Leptospira sp. GIMC2001]WCL49395.1 hypothetical protein O4O04_19210 [Leptospira sp. GIMC2001]